MGKSARLGMKLAELAGWAAVLVVASLHFWAANRGLEMTDEASYLLIALDPWKTWGHGTFHGFLLRPMYLLGGESVVGLRWIGKKDLLAGARRMEGADCLRLGPGKEAAAALATPVLMVAAFTVYSAGMRTPCYNWMILLGAMLAWSGWLRCGITCSGPMELGVGLGLALLGKWGAALILLVLFGALFWRGGKNAAGPGLRDWQKALLTFLAVTAGFAVYAGGAGIRDTLQAGMLIAQTTGSHGWFIGPKYGWELFYYLYRIARAYVWLLPAILVFWWLARRAPGQWPPAKIASILFAAGLALAAARGWWRGGIEQFGKESVLAGGWLLGVVWTIWAIRRNQNAESGGRKPGFNGQAAVLGGLVATPFLCGIGTNTSIADYAGQGTVFFAAAGILMFGRPPTSSVRRVAAIALIGFCLLQASRVSTSLLGMYRVGSVLDQTEMLGEGPEAGRLRLDPGTRRELQVIGSILQEKGFQPGTPVVGVDSLCGWVYLSGGRSPGVPWFFRDQPEYLERVLAGLDLTTLRSSWIWVRSSSRMANPDDWWPQARLPSAREVAGQANLQADRGEETLTLWAPRP